MDSYFSPKCIAIAGASNAEHKLGHAVLQRLLAARQNKVAVIHPHESQILGLSTWSTPASYQEPIDLLIALVPSNRLLSLIEDCDAGQVKYLLAITSGFAEVSTEGQQLQSRVVDAARHRGMRIIGPNSMGMLNVARQLNASLVPAMPPGGAGLSCVTQSGGFGIALSMYALDHQLPIAKICDLGNTSDVQIVEVLDFLEHDAKTHIVGLFLEHSGDDNAFFDAVVRLSKSKPVILTMLGRSEAGRRASLAHLGPPRTLAGERQLRHSSSLIFAKTGHELLDIAKAISWQATPRGRKAAIVTATGGIGAELADLCVDFGIDVPTLSDTLQRRLTPLLPAYAALGNPVDVTPAYSQFVQIYPAVIQVLLASEEIDMLIVSITDVATGLDALAHALVDKLGEQRNTNKPCLFFWGSRDDALKNMRVLESGGFPCYRSTVETACAAAALARLNNS